MLQSTMDVMANYKSRQLCLALWLFYDRLMNYIVHDNGENYVCFSDDNLPETMENMCELIDVIDEMGNKQDRQLTMTGSQPTEH